MLGTTSVLIGFSSIAFAVRLVRRVGRHHAPRTEVARERLSQLRRMWALLVVGGGAGFAGLAFVLTSIHHWLVNPERNVALVLVPIGLTSILIGAALLVATTAVYILGRNRMRTTSEGFSSVPGQMTAAWAAQARPPTNLTRRRWRKLYCASHLSVAGIGRLSMTLPQDITKLQSEMSAAVREHWKAFLFEGILLVVLGLAAMIVPPLAGLAVTIFLGWMFLISGVAGLAMTFWARQMPGFWWSLISAALAIGAGIILLAKPVQGVLTLTIVIGAYFLAEGVATIMYALEHRRELSERWSWMVFAGVLDILISAMIIMGLPGSAEWAIGLLVGINLLFGGASLIGMALAARKSLNRSDCLRPIFGMTSRNACAMRAGHDHRRHQQLLVL